MPSFGDFLHTQLFLTIHKPTASFASKTVIITGGNAGLGKEAAKHVIHLGASKVILGCRNTSTGDQAKLEIETAVKCSPDIIEVWGLDLESPPSIEAFVDRANKLLRLDVLINNAGMSTAKFQVVYGTERTIAVNVIGTFLLTLQLIPKLKETGKTYGNTPHITFVGSAMYDVAKYPEQHGDNIFTWFSDESHVDRVNQYNLSKLFQLYLVIKLASIVDPVANDKSEPSNSIVINTLDPCLCKTGLMRELTGGLKVFMTVFVFLFARTAEEGSRLVVTAASSGRKTHGGYMRAGALQKCEPFITNEDGVKKRDYLWEQLVEKLEKLQPGILANVNTA